MVVSFEKPPKLDHQVKKYTFNVIILMMVHDGFHDFYNDKSKQAFINLFKKLEVAAAATVDMDLGGGGDSVSGQGLVVESGTPSQKKRGREDEESSDREEGKRPRHDPASARMGDHFLGVNPGDRGLGYDRIPHDSTIVNYDVIKVPATTGLLYNQSLSLLEKGELQLHSKLEEIYDELFISLKGDIDDTLLNNISSETFKLIENKDETINIGKNFIISEFYKLRDYKEEFLISPEDKQKCMEIFRFLDKNSDDNITLGEFTSGIINPGTPEIAAFFNIDLPKRPGSEEIDRQEVKDTIVRVFQKIDKDADSVVERGISPTELFNYYSEMQKNEEGKNKGLDNDLSIFKEYILGEGYKSKDFEEYFYETKYGNLKTEERDKSIMESFPEESGEIIENLDSIMESFPEESGEIIKDSGSVNVLTPRTTGKRVKVDRIQNTNRRRNARKGARINARATQHKNKRSSASARPLSSSPVTGQDLVVEPVPGTPAQQTTSSGQSPLSPAAPAPDSPAQLTTYSEQSAQQKRGHEGIGDYGGEVVKKQKAGAASTGQGDGTLANQVQCIPFLENFKEEIDTSTNLAKNILDERVGSPENLFIEYLDNKDDEWWSSTEDSIEGEFRTVVEPLINNILTPFLRGRTDISIAGHDKQLDFVKSLISKYENLKKFYTKKLFIEVKTKSINISIPQRKKDLFDGLSVFYTFNGETKKIYISIVEFMYILSLYHANVVPPGLFQGFKLKSSFIINAFNYGLLCDGKGKGKGRTPRTGYETKELYILYKKLEKKIDEFCMVVDWREKGTEMTESVLTPFFNDNINEYIDVYGSILTFLNRMKKYIEKCKPLLEGKDEMTDSNKDDWKKIFKYFAEDYVKKIGYGSEDDTKLFGNIINYGLDGGLPSIMKKGDSLDKEIWKKLSYGNSSETTYFDVVYSDGNGFTGKKVVNNAMPPQMKKLFPKLNYLCNTSILDPMGSFGSCNKVPFKGPDYDLDYRIHADDGNYININLPVKAINDVSIVNGKVEVVVNGEHMVEDEFTLTHFNSEEPFSISNIVNKLQMIDGGIDTRKDNRKFLFRKFLGDFLQALQVFTNIKNGNADVYYTSNDKPASIMLQILLYSLTSYGLTYPHSSGFNGEPGNYGGHIEKHKPPGVTDPKKYKWKVNYYLSKLDERMTYYKNLITSPPVSPVTRGGGIRKKKTKRRSKRRKSRKNIRRKTRKNTRRKTRKNTRRKNTRRKNTRRKNTSRRSKRSRRK